ncbi:bifunctional N(6)-L-threonylcarbamoyladenine synthase/serine/threonine protein kinase [Haloglomus litoreum]|uniref:bifunctional N(6)-L-threonylcarbamoyladenine synthase/serine/threonine protein kinase n=1 Tax=Haloglomus litoreum TaxID=3034026 RepID=UPI0023E88524|nr:bifunctional N(6)-L-threonylcarbamoyladenine synthase/serine/threonine protein kinase [Haloglomus sp. DT116]
MRVLGIEGTAWAASAALHDTATDETVIETDAYVPESGGIHPREAAEHMREAIPEVVATVLDHARGTHGGATDGIAAGDDATADPPIDAVAFSRGPGLGPCLRIVGTAARSLAGTLDVPLVGVNHMVAHLEIGRHESGFEAPVCLNASGANAHVLGYRNGRYRVLGETLDTGVGNAIDKFTRHLGWSHPGGPKVEQRAREGEYTDLPYVVKGMDFSFSGIMSAAKAAVDDGEPVENVCFALQEHIFAMLTEVAERALSLTGRDELVLGGGVGQNDRLREMLAEMCDARGAEFFAPEPRFLRDNAGMIAVLGAEMAAAGDTLAIADSAVDPDFRPDQVPVTWRDGTTEVARTGTETAGAEVQGAEAVVTLQPGAGRVTKRRVPKAYRHPALDERLRATRTRSEARLTHDARRAGVPTPLVLDVDPVEATLTLEYVGTHDLRADVTADRVRDVAGHLARCHAAGLVHGDPTTRNVRVAEGTDDTGDTDGRTYLVDFGLGYYTADPEDFAMDLHVLGQALDGTADDADALREAALDAYRTTAASADGALDADAVLGQLGAIEGRGRYQ